MFDRHLPFLGLKFQIVQNDPDAISLVIFDQVDRIRTTVPVKMFTPFDLLPWKKAQ